MKQQIGIGPRYIQLIIYAVNNLTGVKRSIVFFQPTFRFRSTDELAWKQILSLYLTIFHFWLSWFIVVTVVFFYSKKKKSLI